MKTRNLFAMAMAAMTFAACSNDDAPAVVGGGENQGELVDAISVYFTNPAKKTYAYSDDLPGVGTENDVYHAFIFAKETTPAHAGALTGDWTVKEVGSDTGAAITEGDESKPGTRKNMATFNGVRQGDNVYVIANDPNLTMAIAEGLAHQGKDSEAAILAYTTTLPKDYLNDLAVKGDADNTQDGKYVMAGKATIPTNPNQPNNTTIRVPVALDRELAKVTFSATVTGDPTKEAYKNVKIQAGDGLIIARIARPVSYYTDHERDWYFPLNGDKDAKDWGYTADGDDKWKVAFDGMTNSMPATADATDFFNKTAKTGAKEYRYSWDTTSSLITFTAQTGADTDVDGGKIASPIFYVTPNYANNSACATVIVTQATYVGPNTLVRDVTSDILKDALAKKTFGADVTEIKGDFWGATGADSNLKKLYDFLIANYANLFKAADYADENALIGYKKNDKVYYRADVANYADDNATSLNVTERNTFYQIQGTITTLGAKSIDAAIDSDNLNMIVQVTVNPWSVVVNRVDM